MDSANKDNNACFKNVQHWALKWSHRRLIPRLFKSILIISPPGLHHASMTRPDGLPRATSNCKLLIDRQLVQQHGSRLALFAPRPMSE